MSKRVLMGEIQKGIYFECLVGNTEDYNISTIVSLNHLQVDVLKLALEITVNKHDSLRMVVEEDDKDVYFTLNDKMHVDIESMQASNDLESKKIINQLILKPYDLYKGPLFRVYVLKGDGNKDKVFIGLHHLIGDGTSLSIFLNQLLVCYRAILNGKDLTVQENPGYIDFLKSEHDNLHNGNYDKQKEYWMEKLAGGYIPELPLDYYGTDEEDRQAVSYVEKFDSDLYKKIECVAQEVELSPFMLGTAIFAMLLGNSIGTKDIIFSTAFTHRPSLDYDDSIGCFIYNLPLRFQLDDEKTIKNLAQNVKEEVYGGYGNLGYPSNKIVRDSNLINEEGQSVLDISFIADFYDVEDQDELEIVKTRQVTFPGKLMVLFENINGEAGINFQYRRNEFSEESIGLLASRYTYLLKQMIQDPNKKLGDFDFITDEEKIQIENFNQSDYFPYRETTILEYFDKKLNDQPNNHGLFWDDGSISNVDLDSLSNRIANTLIEAGVDKEECIGIQLSRSYLLVASILGVIKAGCAYVPIDIKFPEERKSFILMDAGIRLVLTEEGMTCSSAKCIQLSKDQDISTNTKRPDVDVSPRDLCYIEYTSGSTGRPKGVMVEHRSVVNTALDLDRRFPLKKTDVYLLKTSFTFDIFGTEFFGWLVNEGRLFVLQDGGEKDPEEIANAIVENQVTHINFVPSMFHAFLDYIEVNPIDLSSLKYIFVGGEAVNLDIVNRYFTLGWKATLENVYGPTEATMWATHYPIKSSGEKINIPIGKPLNAYKILVLDENLNLQPIGIEGELYITGPGLARGYKNLPEKTHEAFVQNPFYNPERDPEYMDRLYKTGDLGRWTISGNLEFAGRKDFQVKVNGMRVELGEIEVAMNAIEGIGRTVVSLEKNREDLDFLCAFYTGDQEISDKSIRHALEDKIPSYMIPSKYIYMDQVPLLENGKVNKKALSQILKSRNIEDKKTGSQGDSKVEGKIKTYWMAVLGREDIDKDELFFDVGGNSLKILKLQNKIQNELGIKIKITELLKNPTIAKMAYLVESAKGGHDQGEEKKEDKLEAKQGHLDDVAIVGLGLNVPGAQDVEVFWDNLVGEKETIRYYGEEELIDLGIPESQVRQDNYIRAHGPVEDLDYFDEKFFGLTPAEIKQSSPQLRILYETAWKALEDAGESTGPDNNIGVYIGGSDDFNWYKSALYSDSNYSNTYQSFTMATNHFLSTRLSYMFNLKGPSMTTLTGCSTSLLTVHLARKAIQNGECEVALAGGITIESPNHTGYSYIPGMMFSPDGHVRPFDAQAAGTVFSNGCGLVVLKSLEAAKRDGNHIYAVIKGSASNNDGSMKLSFTAPSEDGQVDVIKKAQRDAQVFGDTIGYVEAHGTGTFLGDPIEVTSLTRAFDTDQKDYCVLGSVKGNIGHTDTAAGVVGLIKTALSLDKKYIPATINFKDPNPNIDFINTPFRVVNEGKAWEIPGSFPRRAAINSFGVGGTNVHMILEEEAETSEDLAPLPFDLLCFSGKTEKGVEATREKICKYIYDKDLNTSLAANTLAHRRGFDYRTSLVVPRTFKEDPWAYWQNQMDDQEIDQKTDIDKVTFLFSGQGTQYQGMARDLYNNKDYTFAAIFSRELDRVFSMLTDEEEALYRDVLFGDSQAQRINQTLYSQFTIFAVEYAMAKVFLSLGVKPDYLIGHSIGELTAASLAEVWTLQDTVRIILERSRLMQAQDFGVMLALSTDQEEIENYLNENTWISLNNSSSRLVVGGTHEGIDQLKGVLEDQDIDYKVLKTSHAFHTPMMDKAAKDFEDFLKNIPMASPKIPIYSNVTGDLVDPNYFCTPKYWSDHITKTVQFEKELSNLLKEPMIFIELGSGRTLASFVNLHKTKDAKMHKCVTTIRHPRVQVNDIEFFLGQVGKLWKLGLDIDWTKIQDKKYKKAIHLPSYEFEKNYYPVQLKDISFEEKANLKEETEASNRLEQLGKLNEEGILEEIIASYKEVFGYEELGPGDDFFELGGDSLKAASLASILESRLGRKVSINEIFQANTPKKLSKVMDVVELVGAENRIRPGKKADSYPLSSSQERMFTFYQMDPEALAYNLPSVTLIEGDLDLDKVRGAMAKLIDQHEALRTQFEMIDDKARQVVLDSVEVPFTCTEKSCQDEAEFKKIFKDFVRPFQLDQAPLFRAEIIKTGEEKYLLMFDIHHIVSDATAVETISDNFNAFYFGKDLPKIIQYKDYALWEKENSQSEETAKQRSYWLDTMSGDLPSLDLPTDYERPKYLDFKGARFEFDIPKYLAKKIASFSRQHEATNFMTLLSAWSGFLSLYSGDEEIIVGTPVSGRTKEEIRDTVGMFVNMLPIRSYPKKDKSYINYFKEVKGDAFEALANQDYPFDKLVEDLDLPRSLNHHALFDVSFDYHNIDIKELHVEGIRFKEIDTPIESASIDLLLTVNEGKEGQLNGFIDYATSLFDEKTIDRISKMFIKYLEHALDDPSQKLVDIPILLEEDLNLYRDQEKKYALDFDPSTTILDLWKETLKDKGDKTALVSSREGKKTFTDLDQKSNGIAWALLENGLKKGEAVGIYARRNLDLFAAIYGVMKAGGAYVNIDPSYPEDRVNYMMDAAKINHLLVFEDEDLDLDFSGSVLITSNIEPRKDWPKVEVRPEDTIYICFTSGSTGRPKGVQVLHQGIANYCMDNRNNGIFCKDQDECIICMASPSFDIFGVESIIPLALGTRVFLANEEENMDVSKLSKIVEEDKITHIQAPISRLRAMLESKAFEPVLDQLRVIIGGGEHYPENLLSFLQDKTRASLYNCYGPTETTISATFADLTYGNKVNIGRPLDNCQVYIANSQGSLSPIGVYGELYIGGRGLSNGYVNNPEATKEAFTELKDLPGVRVYKTGDVGRMVSDGTIELRGRIDNQVKIRGYRVELGEIEKICLQMEEVEAAVAKVVKRSETSEEIVLFYILASGQVYPGFEEKLRDRIERQLPNYMVPSKFIEKKEFPYLPNGKVNRKALKDDQVERPDQARSVQPVKGTLEKELVKIWKDILGLKDLSTTDNFFDVGGNSYSLMLVNNRLKEDLQVEIPFLVLFEYPTIQSLASYLSEGKGFVEEDLIQEKSQVETSDIAVIGMDGKFPQADNLDILWENLIQGKESIRSFSEEELEESGIQEREYKSPNYVNAKGYLDDTEYFDYEFFKYNRRDAERMDPQIRLFHQCVYHALEDAGYDSTRYQGKIGLFAGSSSNVPWMANLINQNPSAINMFELATLNDKDFLTTKVSYKLNLKGPSITVQTACSTSLVSICQASQYLLNGDCDIALAGGVSVTYPQKEGYVWNEGMIFAKDGHCRPFSSDSTGTVSGNGCGVVVLKRLSDAKRDGDYIYAVIKGTAVNNDGNHKIGYTAPSISGQREVIEKALRKANISPADIDYVEAHGTGTSLGDPIEIEGLKQAWKTSKKNYCGIGSVKANVGHLDAAAGVIGFIKAVLILEHRQIPKQINFLEANPKIDFANSPFYVSTRNATINKEGKAHAAVSAFGIGGTNAHVILEEAPDWDA